MADNEGIRGGKELTPYRVRFSFDLIGEGTAHTARSYITSRFGAVQGAKVSDDKQSFEVTVIYYGDPKPRTSPDVISDELMESGLFKTIRVIEEEKIV